MSGAAVTVSASRRAVAAEDRAAREAWAPLALGACGGSLVAGRFETVLLCVGVAVVVSFAVSAAAPRARWTTMLIVSMATALALNLYLVAGRPLALPHVFSLIPTREGLRLGALLALRLLGAALSVHALGALWPGERAADELAGLLRPLRPLALPIDEARTVLGLALRFMPLLGVEAARIARLQTLRAGRAPRGIAERVTRLRARMVPSLVAALERAEQVSLALEARHYLSAAAVATRRPAVAWIGGGALLGVALLWRS